jgi:hypothetical protein
MGVEHVWGVGGGVDQIQLVLLGGCTGPWRDQPDIAEAVIRDSPEQWLVAV